MNSFPSQLVAFDISVQLIWQKIPIEDTNQAMHLCDEKQFYLAIPGIARFLALPESNCIIIETAQAEISIQVLNTWLLGTVMAYILQYHGYLVLHGSAVLINDRAVILSGQSGAGKSTLASALLKQGYPFITDDVVVIKQIDGQYTMIPGPAQLKLWRDAASHLEHDIAHAQPVSLKIDKYAIPVTHRCDLPTAIPITAFYELNIAPLAKTFTGERLTGALALRTIVSNAYRYFMLKPLGKLQSFLNDCSQLTQQIAVHKITRRPDLSELFQIIQRIELDQRG